MNDNYSRGFAPFDIFNVAAFSPSGIISDPGPALHALTYDPVTFQMLGVKTGTGVLANGRSTTRYVEDHEGVYHSIAATAPAWYGARYSGGVAYADSDGAGTLIDPLPMLDDNPAATNEVLYSNDLTNWTATGSPTVTFDQPGIDGAANTASKILGLGSINVSDVRQDVSGMTSSALMGMKIWLKTITTSGNLRITNRLGTSLGRWVVDLSKVSTTDFEALTPSHAAVTENNAFITNASGLSGIVFYAESGIQDIIVGNVNYHDDKTNVEVRNQGPIFTTTTAVQVNADEYSFNIANHDNSEGAIYFKWKPSYSTSEVSGDEEMLSPATAAGLAYYDGTNGNVESTDGTNTAEKAETIVAGTVYEVGVIYSTSDSEIRVCVGGVWGTAVTYDGAYTVGSVLALFRSATYSASMGDLQIWAVNGATAQKAKIDELMA